MTLSCPSDLALERHLLEADRSPLLGHVAGCPACTARLEEMRRQGEQFHQYVFPATVAAIEAAARSRRPARLRWLGLGAALAVAAAAVLLVRGMAPEDDLAGPGALGFTVVAHEGGRTRTVRDGEAVSASASLRFSVRTPSDCRLWILALGAGGEVVRLYPGEGTGGAAVRGAVEIPAAVALDGQAGPERLYAVCTPGPSKWRVLGPLLKGGPGSGETVVRAVPEAGRLPSGTRLASVLLEKRT